MKYSAALRPTLNTVSWSLSYKYHSNYSIATRNFKIFIHIYIYINMSTIVFPDHPSPIADAEALRKAFQGTYNRLFPI